MEAGERPDLGPFVGCRKKWAVPACLSWPASLWSGPSCLDRAKKGPVILILEAPRISFWGAQEGSEPPKKPCTQSLRDEHHPPLVYCSACSCLLGACVWLGCWPLYPCVLPSLHSPVCWQLAAPDAQPQRILEQWGTWALRPDRPCLTSWVTTGGSLNPTEPHLSHA